MGEQTKKTALEVEEKWGDTFKASIDEQKDIDLVSKDLVTGRQVINKSYNQFNGRSLYDCIDDWTKRWNGYLPIAPALTADRSNMFLNFTRNMIISFLSKVALQQPDIKILAVNKNSGQNNMMMAKCLQDLNTFSNNQENAQTKFLESALEAATKGTVIKHEGYLKYEQETDVVESYNSQTGEIKTRKDKQLLFDDCCQENVFIEDFYIANPYQPDIQKQPWVIWKKCQTYDEAEKDLGEMPYWKYVQPGNYSINTEPTTFYRNQLQTELTSNQVEVLKYYNRRKNKHVILVNGIPIYRGVIPFKDGKYPFAKGWHEPFGNDFFWGMGFPQKIMGDQDLINTLWNMMVDKTYGSLSPFGLSSDLDDLVEDTVLEPNKIRKVGDINNWRFETLPGVQQGEQSVLQSAISFIRENSGVEGGHTAASPQGGKVTMRQAMLKQQESLQRLGFTMNYLEDFEKDRTELRINHILQFYSIPKIESVTGKSGKDIENFLYRKISVPESKLPEGKQGTRIIKLVDNDMISGKGRKKLEDEMSVEEARGEVSGTPTEVLAINVDSFYNYEYKIQVVKNSSYERNQMLDQARLMEFANWRINLYQLKPFNIDALIRKIEESQDIDPDEIEQSPSQSNQMNPQMMAAMAQQGQGQQGQQGQQTTPMQQMAPSKNLGLDSMM